ncbi:MAG TPA: AI-2E family transporter [Thermomicrobiaceae bacterium]|nr:AI-2E family transporter [Thermomicrobiaceae bacterium]
MDYDPAANDDPPDGIQWQRAFYAPLTILAWLAVIVVVGWLLGHVTTTLLTLVMSAIVAFALTPLVEVFDRWMPRAIAIALAYIFGFGLVAGLIALLVVTAATQLTNLVHALPGYVSAAKHLQPSVIRVLGPLGVTATNFQHAEQRVIADLQTLGSRLAAQSLSILQSVVTALVEVVLVLILSVYLTANGPRISAGLRKGTPVDERWHTALVIAVVDRVVGGYVRGTLLMATFIGTLVGIGMFFIGVPYAVLLGLLAFFMEFVPIFGVFISGTVSVLVALSQGWVMAVMVLAYFIGVHVLEGEIVGPRVMGRAVGIHPAVALLALIAGTELFGIWGALFGAPIAGLVQAIGTAVYYEARGARPKVVAQSVVRDETEAEKVVSAARRQTVDD